MPHIAEEFKQAEYLDYYDWQWLKSELAKYPANEVEPAPPPQLVAPVIATVDEMPVKQEPSFAAPPDGSERNQMQEVSAATLIVPGGFEVRLSYNGKACIFSLNKANEPVGMLAETNVVDIRDPLDFFRSLELRQNSGSAVT